MHTHIKNIRKEGVGTEHPGWHGKTVTGMPWTLQERRTTDMIVELAFTDMDDREHVTVRIRRPEQNRPCTKAELELINMILSSDPEPEKAVEI